jgi:hypothetical protein
MATWDRPWARVNPAAVAHLPADSAVVQVYVYRQNSGFEPELSTVRRATEPEWGIGWMVRQPDGQLLEWKARWDSSD